MGTTATDGGLPPLDEDHPLTVEEVRLLWSFVHGDIMDETTRELLRRSWGLCARHSWGHAVVEIELWQTGAGTRGGHQPFDVSILLEDLIGQATSLLATARPRRLPRALRGDQRCRICADLRPDGAPGLAIGYAGFDSEPLAREANGMRYTRGWISETAPQWRPRVCPACLDGTASTTPNADKLCRLHLIRDGAPDSAIVAQVEALLRPLPHRLHRLVDSMTDTGEASTTDEDASWVEALGWLHGWELPLALTPPGHSSWER